MSIKIDEFCESMRVKLNSMEAQVEQAKTDIGKAQKDSADAFDRKLAEARTAVEGQRNEVEAAGVKLRHWVTAKTEAGEATIATWKANFDKSELERHANRAEDNALDAVFIAQAAIADAELAIYEAIVARQHASAEAR